MFCLEKIASSLLLLLSIFTIDSVGYGEERNGRAWKRQRDSYNQVDHYAYSYLFNMCAAFICH